MQTEKAVGVFDSGVGGLSVLSHIHKCLPREHMMYVADSAFMPYGCKTAEEVRARCLLVAEFLLNQGVKALVVACNTATSMAVQTLRTELDIPVIGMEPAVKPAVHGGRASVIGVLATSGTLNSDRFKSLESRFATQVELIGMPCPGLVELIEQGDLQTDQIRHLLASYLQPLLDNGMDALVLGCTHYPFVSPLIRQIIGDDIAIIDTGAAIARELERQLHSCQLLSKNHQDGNVQFWSTGDTARDQSVMSCLWGEPLQLNSLDLPYY